MKITHITALIALLAYAHMPINASNLGSNKQTLVKQTIKKSPEAKNEELFFKLLYEKSSLIKRMVHPSIENWLEQTAIQTIPNFQKTKLLWTKEAFGKTLIQYADTENVTSANAPFNSLALDRDFKHLITSRANLISQELNKCSLKNLIGLFPLCRYLLISKKILNTMEDEIAQKTSAALTQNTNFFKTALGKDLKRVLKIHGFEKKTRHIPEALIDHNAIKEGHSLVSFSPNGALLATLSEDNTITILNAKTMELIHTLHHDGYITSLAFSPDSTRLATGLDTTSNFPNVSGSATVWNVKTGTLLQTLPHNHAVISVAFSPDSTRVVTGSYDGDATIWDVQTGDLKLTMQHNVTVGMWTWVPQIQSIAFSPDGTLLVTGSNNHNAKVWNAQTGILTHNLQHNSSVCVVAFSPNDMRVAIGTSHGTIYVWNPQNGALLQMLHNDNARKITSIVFNPDGTRLAVGTENKTIAIWKLATRTLLRVFYHDAPVSSLSFNPTGTRLAAASQNSIKIVYETEELSLANFIMIKYLNALKKQNKYIELAQEKTIKKLIEKLSSSTQAHYLSNGTIFPIENQCKAWLRKVSKAIGLL
ncbi:TPA: hypothetical protein DDZ86_04220 [Candidatus Dependentiae bacterium]|nr:MAG: hypothetical protein UW09_C0003G0191 [candidate division TM6 bacterium GW2011_GWF2_43_87]HBL98820.1 hypothetical protein [Candidatus Dependentiae bacterium]